ncbi:hypothetical protein FRC08_014179, partial [Ceratobasidium sp. 394]
MCNPRWFNKPKFHVLLHLPGHVIRLGPPILFATETFESYNYVIRLRSIHSNQQAPSADIGASFSLLHAMQHLVSGGYFQLADDKSSSGSISSAPWIQAGPKVRALIHDKTFVKFMGLSELSKTSAAGLCVPLPNPQGVPIRWTSTLASDLLSSLLAEATPDLVVKCRSLRLDDKSKVSLEDFALIHLETTKDPSTSHGNVIIAQIQEILAEHLTQRAIVLVMKPFKIGTPIPPYHFPLILPSEQPALAINILNIITPVSVFHDCANLKCTLSKTRQMRQERQVLDSYQDEVQHTSQPNRLVLNVAQLRSADSIHAFYPDMSPPYPPIDEAIDQGLTRQVQSQEQEQIEQQEKETQAAERAKKKEEKEGQPAKKRKVRGSTPSHQPSQRFHPYSGTSMINSRLTLHQHGPSGFRANTLTPGNFESSPGPARGWPGYNGEITLPGDQGASNNTTIPPLAVDSIANEQGLSGPQRAELHRFSKENAGVQHTQVHAHQLALDNKLAGIQSALANVQGIMAQVLKTATETWNPTESQKKAVYNMCWNYLTYDLNSYLQMHEEVVTSVGADPVGILGLEGYGSEPILTDAVKAYIRTEANNVKSRFKKH